MSHHCTNCATGPRTPQGKAISARNATTHGLFARDIVLPALGEDPEGYRQLEAEFIAQINPQNLLERHYVEKIAAASWRLRRLHRWQAQLFEDDTLTEDECLDKLDKVLRHETALHRQIDTAVKMLNKDVPQLSQSRARAQALLDLKQTELDCRENRENELEVIFESRELLKEITAYPPLDHELLDAVPVPSDSPLPFMGEGLEVGANEGPGVTNEDEICENERLRELLTHDISEVHPDGRPVYITAYEWEWLEGRSEAVRLDYDAYFRQRFLFNQQEAQERLAPCL